MTTVINTCMLWCAIVLSASIVQAKDYLWTTKVSERTPAHNVEAEMKFTLKIEVKDPKTLSVRIHDIHMTRKTDGQDTPLYDAQTLKQLEKVTAIIRRDDKGAFQSITIMSGPMEFISSDFKHFAPVHKTDEKIHPPGPVITFSEFTSCVVFDLPADARVGYMLQIAPRVMQRSESPLSATILPAKYYAVSASQQERSMLYATAESVVSKQVPATVMVLYGQATSKDSNTEIMPMQSWTKHVMFELLHSRDVVTWSMQFELKEQ